jgi:anti-sigma factor (TIGR02949 family)
MDCKDARLLLAFARPGEKELDHDEAEALRQHLADCPDCAAQAQAESRADEHIGRAMRDVPVPAGLRERLLQKLGDERAPWYRRWRVRLAGAAALLLAACLGYVWLFAGRPPLERDEMQRLTARLFSAAEAKKAFEELGVTVAPPSNFKYHILDSYGLVMLQGQRVPYLLFHFTGEGANSRPALARVYLLSSQQFDLEQTKRNANLVSTSTHTVKAEPNPDDPNGLLLIIYTGGRLDVFCKNYQQG